MPHSEGSVKANTPLYALGAAVIFGGYAVVLVVTDHMDSTLFVGFLVTTLPSLVAAAFAERTARDVRNGVVQDKIRQGTHEALRESGVTEVAATALQSQPATTSALAHLVDSNTRMLEMLNKRDEQTNAQEGTGA